MRFNISASQTKKVVEKKLPVTLDAHYDMEELNFQFDKAHNAVLKTVNDNCELFASLTIAEIKKNSKALESLGSDNLKNLAAAFGCSVEELDAMSVADFSKKAYALTPKSLKADVSNEELATIVAVSLCALYVLFIAGLCASASKFTKYDMPFLEQSARKTLEANAKEALTQITANTFKADDYVKAIKGCNEVLKFLDTDAKTFYDPKYPIAKIELMAKKLWVTPTTQAFAGDDDSAWWKEWRDNMPKREFDTLGGLGFTVKSLVDICSDLEDLAAECNKLWRTWVAIKNGRAEARKGEPGFFGRIKRFFTETEDELNARKHKELILNAKYQALRNLMWGIDIMGRAMFNDFIYIAVKTQNYIVKAEKKEAAAKEAAKKPAKK